MWITPFSKDTAFKSPWTIDDKIRIFEESTRGWQLDIAEICINGGKDHAGNNIPIIKDSGFAVLHILLSYFEMIAKYEDGFTRIGKSEFYFKEGVKSVFPNLYDESRNTVDRLLDIMYHKTRCGLYHGGLTEKNVILTGEVDFPIGFDAKNEILVINPHKLPRTLMDHLDNYVTKLRDSKYLEIRKNFERRFDSYRQ